MKTIKTILKILSAAFIFFTLGCSSTNLPKTEFEEKTGLSVIIPMRYFTWVRTDGAETFMDDYVNGKITFDYSADADYLVKIEKTETGISTLWGNQLTAVNSSVKHIVFTAFISAAYSSAEQKDPLETAFNVLLQIFADPLYTSKKELLLPALKDGVDAYNGGTGWAEYKEAHFSTADGTITVIE